VQLCGSFPISYFIGLTRPGMPPPTQTSRVPQNHTKPKAENPAWNKKIHDTIDDHDRQLQETSKGSDFVAESKMDK